MIDDSKRKQLIIAAVVFITLVILAFIGFLFFNNRSASSNLPPVDDTQTTTESTDAAGSNTTSADAKASVSYKNNIAFNGFGELTRQAITDIRVDVIFYVLSKYANEQKGTKIEAYTMDANSYKEAKNGEKNIITFNSTDNNNVSYKVELSYTYAADAFVRVFDKNNKVIATSPYAID